MSLLLTKNSKEQQKWAKASSGRRLRERQRGRGTPKHCPLCDLSLEAGACLVQRKTKARGSELTEGVCDSPCVLASFSLLWIKCQTSAYSRNGLLWLMTSQVFILHGGEGMAELAEVGAWGRSLSHWRAMQEPKRTRTRFSCNLQRLTHRYQLFPMRSYLLIAAQPSDSAMLGARDYPFKHK